jgi:hypothetical protein
MAVESIGTLVPTKIPGLSDAADIQAALRAYHYGSYSFDTAEDDPAELINPSIAYTINNLQTQITAAVDDYVDEDVLTAKGSLITASAASTPVELGIGSNGHVLTANSSATYGLEWSAPAVTASNTVTLTNKTLTAPIATLATNAQAASYTLVLTDQSDIVEMGVGSANDLTIPLNSSVAFPIGTVITILQTGSGQTTIVGTGGVTVNGSPGLKLRGQWSSATLVKRDTNTWVAIGDLTA